MRACIALGAMVARRAEQAFLSYLGLEVEVLRRGPQQHLAQLDPVLGVQAAHEALQVIPAVL